MDHSLWVEKYRPKTLEECVLPERVRTVVQSYVDKKDVPNLLFYGSAGTSKTTLAKALVNELGAEMLFIDASSDNGKQMITNSIVPFASTVSVMNQDVPKIILLDESDGLTFQAQQSIRPIIEQYSKNTRFIFTLNYPTKIIPAIKSRCVVFDFNVGKAEKPSLMAQFLNRVIAILEKEGITNYNKKVLALYIAKNFPDYRKIVNELQSFVSAYDNLDEGILTFGTDDIAGVLYPMIAKKEFEQMRKWILESSYSADDIFTALYTSMPLFVDEKGMQANYILILAKYQYQQGFVANQTLNLVACLTEMMIS